MDSFKIDNYERRHGPGTFVPFRHLPAEETLAIRTRLLKMMRLPDDTLPLELLEVVASRSVQVPAVSAGSEGFDLGKLLCKLELDVPAKAYLNWYRFDDIDEVSSLDLLEHFDNIWYPVAEDLDILDSAMRWIVMVHHEGFISVLRLGQDPE